MTDEFSARAEELEDVTKHMKSCNAIMLSIISPFTPLRISPARSIVPSFGFPDEFAIEDFIEKVTEKYPDKEKRPPLHIVIHSPGGTVSSSYVTSKVLRENFKEIVGFIPHMAASGATILSLSCNKLVFGNISRLTGINPIYFSDGGISSPLSVLRSFDKLEEELATKAENEISYPKKHLLKTITAEELDDASHVMDLVEQYTSELMNKAGYKETEVKKVITDLLYDVDAHEQVFLLDIVKKIGINAIHIKEEPKLNECWNVARKWLFKYYLQPSPMHVIRYAFPSNSKSHSKNKEKNEANA